MTLKEFRDDLLKKKKLKKHRVTNSLTPRNGYKYYNSIKPKQRKYNIDRQVYMSIIKDINSSLAERLIIGEDVTFPHGMGRLEIRKYNSEVYYDSEGNLRLNLPVDWNKTTELWYTDEEAFKNKTLVYRDEGEVYKIYYNRKYATYEHKSVYKFYPARSVKIKLSNNIKKGIVYATCMERDIKW